ncbi:ThuA domain-containing protein [Chryseolinea sp. H1M3-3]|uniref:ThuA domain-containing protein n=1 Tax=Chryseolinea sp. H1M3-3 TaxID=3034144 RepID=UPI0023EBC54E|nr:ThuA domain-containing protein [Chryseolinea sp. H1M3-3]
MKSYLAIFVMFCLLLSCGEKQKAKVLVFSKTKGYRHEAIGVGKLTLIELGKQNDFEVDTTENAAFFNEDSLKRYRAVIFLNTTMDVLDPVQQADFKRFIQAGGGFMGVHAAADTEYEWPWYGDLLGAYFKSHPKTQEAKFVKAKEDDLVKNQPKEWVRTDELYNYKRISKDINVLYTLDETSYEGGENGDYHPIAWYHEFDGGRSFYTGMGHTPESYADPLFRDHLLQGIKYAIGSNKPDYSKAKTVRAPEENRFTKTVLDFNLDEPTEMAIMPDGKIIFVERKGAVKLYTPSDGKVNLINTFSVGTKFEDGVIGLTLDPNFEKNNWVYVFYSHPQRSANIVSRFVFKDGKIDQSSEKEILEVATQRETCCHTGGSLAFGPNGNLFISTGDNTSPFESDGYSPSDETPGRSPFDAQKSSGNTNDLRGKILRIHPEPDGSYTIPEGNLFPKGEPNTRPEIYVMGCRNPYRISVDQKTGFVYWGDVGPDAGQNDSLRGPRGYDELNQAQKPGFFGWPYFVGNNYPYGKYDFATKQVSKKWDAKAPLNESPNNTGKKELPPVSPPFIFYPYDRSDEFPMAKVGGRNAMAGPIYYSENYKGVETAFPEYFDGKLMFFDWMRNWIYLATMNDKGAITDIEPFMPNTTFNNISDMAYGPDGKLYMLEYGTKWFSRNLDARLVRIDFNKGNRPPVADLKADKTSGSTPVVVNFSAKGSIDPDGDKVTYELEAGGKKHSSADGNFSITFDKPEVINAVLTVKDDKGSSHTASARVVVGNEAPVVKTEISEGNKTFFFPGTPVKYKVTVSDKEDGSTEQGKIKPEEVTVTFDYMKGFDMTHIAQGHQAAPVELPGKALIEKSDCKSCHLIDQKSAGPSYKDVAAKYNTQKGAVELLATKVIKGGSGVWGTTEMAAHPQISDADASKMVEYILSLADSKAAKKLPLAGSATPGKEQDGVYVLTSTYMDKAVNNVPSLTSTDALVLRSSFLRPNEADAIRIARKASWQGNHSLQNLLNGAFAMYKNLDLTGVKKATLMAFIDPREFSGGGTAEIHLDKIDGPLLGSATVVAPGVSAITTPIQSTTGHHDLYIVFKNSAVKDRPMFTFTGMRLENK